MPSRPPAGRQVSPPEGAGHYFDARPEASSAPRTVDLVLPDLTVGLTTDRSVFSGDRVDPGTRYLLLEAPAPLPSTRDALDLGCGYGPVAVTLAHRAPQARVWAVDVNERAVALCRANAAATGATGVRASVASDERPWGEVPDGTTFDVIWSNPPIRIGKPALHTLLGRWLDRLSPGGRAWLVVHRNLGADSLQRWLDDGGWHSERVSSRVGYRLLRVDPRAAAPAGPTVGDVAPDAGD